MPNEATIKSSFPDTEEAFDSPTDDYIAFAEEAAKEGIDEGKPQKSGRQMFVEEREQRLKLEKEISDAQMAALQKAHDLNPELRKFGLSARVHVFRRKPPGFTHVIPKIVEVLLWTGRSERTQTAVLQEALSYLPGQSASPNIWSKKLSPGTLKRIKTKVRCNKPNLDIKGCDTLSAIKKAIAANGKTSTTDKSIKVSITITSDSVVINKTALPISVATTGAHSYSRIRVPVGKKRQWIRVDALQALLSV